MEKSCTSCTGISEKRDCKNKGCVYFNKSKECASCTSLKTAKCKKEDGCYTDTKRTPAHHANQSPRRRHAPRMDVCGNLRSAHDHEVLVLDTFHPIRCVPLLALCCENGLIIIRI